MSFKIRGKLPNFAKAAAEITGLAEVVVAKSAFDLERLAKQAAPVRTGNLRSSISTDVRGLEAEVGPTANYGVFVELGTSRQAPQPYLMPAADKVEDRMEKALQKVAEKALGKL